MDPQLEARLGEIETANAALERAVLAEDWDGAAISDAALNDALHVMNELLEDRAGVASDGALEAIVMRLGHVLAIHDRMIGVITAARDVAGKDLDKSRLGRVAAFHYLDTAGLTGR